MHSELKMSFKKLINPQFNLGGEVQSNNQKPNLYVDHQDQQIGRFLESLEGTVVRRLLEVQLGRIIISELIISNAESIGSSNTNSISSNALWCFSGYYLQAIENMLQKLLNKDEFISPICFRQSIFIKLTFKQNIINMLSFYALKQNDKLIHGSLSTDPLTGLFQYNTLVNLSLYEQIKPSKGFLDCLSYNIEEHKKVMETQAPIVLYQMNKITFKEFMKFTQKDEYESKQKILDQIKEIFQYKMNQEMTKEEKDKFLDYPKPKSLPLLTKIDIQKTGNDPLQQWKDQQPIIFGGYSEIRKVQLAYKIIDNNQTYSRALAVKTEKVDIKKPDINSRKVNHELQILKNLSQMKEQGNGESYIVTSYYDENLDDCYFMEFYNNGSLEEYNNTKSKILSLRTKLFILAGIVNGIDFLHYKQIAHLDLKMGNILIQKQLIPKICDFGEAKPFDLLKQEKSNFSRSLPYAAPELYNSNEITPAFDIFSFGILMCKFIFDQFPFEFNPNDLSNLAERYKNNTYAIKTNLKYQTKYGPKKIMKKILDLIRICLLPDPQRRPKPKWILAILWKMINFLDSF